MRRALIAGAAAVLFASDAGAHAELVSSSPADGASIAAAPAVIELRFNEPVQPIALRLTDRDGKRVALSTPQRDGALVHVEPAQSLGDGTYVLSYRVTSLDSHPVSGAIAFGIGTAPPPSQAAEPARLHVVGIAVRALRDFALLVAAGAALFYLVLGSFPRDATVLRLAGLIGAAASVLGIGFQGAALLGETSGAAWRAGFASSFGLSASTAAAALLAIALATYFPAGRVRGAVLGFAIALSLCSLPLTGHAQIARPALVAVVALAAHALAAAFWAGSLTSLLLVLRGEPARAPTALRRFSPFGMGAVAVLVVAGVTLAILQLHAPSDLAASAYGRLIVAKAAVLGVLIALALMNRYVLLIRLERGAGRRAMTLSVLAEFVLIAGVVAITAILLQTPPPTSALRFSLHEGDLRAELSIMPGRAGLNTFVLQLASVEEASLEIANPTAGIEPIVRPMRRVAADQFRYQGGELAFGGTWLIAIHARIGDFDKRSFRTQVKLGSAPALLAQGEVVKVDPAAQRITIRHGPIASLGMPAMTMVFQAASPSMIERVQPGDKVRFEAEKLDGGYAITRLERGQ